jgi:predicted Zn-dependent protease
MQRKILRDLLILLGVFGLIWLVFSLFSYPDDPQLVSKHREEQLGDTYLEFILLNPMFQELNNSIIDSALGVIAERLVEGLEDSEYDYDFVVFESAMINAFTLPGANILISSGLIAFCDGPEELAAIMAHEMAHVEKRHVISRLVKELGIEILTSGDQFILGEITGSLSSSRFDRKQETQADLFAAQLLESADIEPRTLASLFRKLEKESNAHLLEDFEIVSTHPNFSSRIREALNYRPAEDFHAREFALDWEAIKAALK